MKKKSTNILIHVSNNLGAYARHAIRHPTPRGRQQQPGRRHRQEARQGAVQEVYADNLSAAQPCATPAEMSRHFLPQIKGNFVQHMMFGFFVTWSQKKVFLLNKAILDSILGLKILYN